MPFAVKSYGEPPTYDEVAEYDAVGNEVYHGWAAPGTLTTRPWWMILKIGYTLNVSTNIYMATSWRWANGNREPNKVWDDRATYTYV